MAKWYGNIGYAEIVETEPGIWVEQFTERAYYGDVVRNTRRLQPTESVNDNISISNEFSIMADPFAIQHFYEMRYIVFMGAKWKITDVEYQYPRLKLLVGGLYNGEQA